MINLTKHGFMRLRERVGIPPRAANRQANIAFKRGEILKGKRLAQLLPNAVAESGTYVRYGRFLYVFSHSRKGIILITVLCQCPRFSFRSSSKRTRNVSYLSGSIHSIKPSKSFT